MNQGQHPDFQHGQMLAVAGKDHVVQNAADNHQEVVKPAGSVIDSSQNLID